MAGLHIHPCQSTHIWRGYGHYYYVADRQWDLPQKETIKIGQRVGGTVAVNCSPIFYRARRSSRAKYAGVCCTCHLAYGWSMVLLFACTHSSGRQAVLGAIYSIFLLVPTLLLLFLAILVSDFSHNEVVRSASSPSDVYVAKVILNSQGALGGGTLVRVTCQNSKVNLFVGILQRPPDRIYSGRWGEFYNMQLYWETDEILHVK